jgi:hypothetical protein
MKLPASAQAGMVLSYAYLWAEEYGQGKKEGAKNRPVAVIAVRSDLGPSDLVYVVPVTHSPPQRDADKLKIPLDIKRRLQLDDEPSWIDVTELNAFVWPGYDLRPVAQGDAGATCSYGYLPSRFLRKIQNAIQQSRAEQKLKLVPR